MSKFLLNTVALALLAAPAAAQAPAGDDAGKLGIGREAHPDEIAAWDVKVMPDGRGLPDGSGSVADGEELFIDYCAVCHGDFAEGVGNWPKLAGGDGSLSHDDPNKTVGSYWPYLSTVWDYIHRSMPFGQAQILTPDETYAITAYILYSNFLVDDDFVLSKDNFLEVEMPNADGFFIDDREEIEYPVFSTEPCMQDCKQEVEITMRASNLDVTPGTDEDDEDQGEADGQAEQAEAQAEVEAQVEAAAEDTPDEAVDPGADGTDPDAPVPAEPAPADGAGDGDAAEDAGEAEPDDSAAGDAAQGAAAEQQAAAATPDPELVSAGERVFNKCKACHMVGEAAKNRVGPVLNGVVGAPVGHVEDFSYSSAMEEAGENGAVWTAEALKAYLADPRGAMPGNKMAFAGLRSEAEQDAVVAFLQAHP